MLYKFVYSYGIKLNSIHLKLSQKLIITSILILIKHHISFEIKNYTCQSHRNPAKERPVESDVRQIDKSPIGDNKEFQTMHQLHQWHHLLKGIEWSSLLQQQVRYHAIQAFYGVFQQRILFLMKYLPGCRERDCHIDQSAK